MLFTWIDLGTADYEAEIESWSTDADTIKYAIDDTISEEYAYYINNSDYELNRTFFCKVVLDGDIIAADLFLLRDDSRNIVHINPIIINPKHRNKGYCTKIIGELVNNISKIIGYESIAVTADFDLENKASIRAFEKVGFVMAGIHTSADFTYWTYPASKVEDYRKFCTDSMGDKFIATMQCPN